MALRILPFRQYAEQDVINLYALDSSDINAQLDTKGNGDAGVFVKISAGDLDGGPVALQASSYLGKTDYPYVGRDYYPTNVLQVTVAGTGDAVLGMTLNQTAKADENGEKLLYYPQKALENQAVLSGQAVPVLQRGIVTLNGETGAGAFGNNAYVDDANWIVGNKVCIAEGGEGKLTGVAPGAAHIAHGARHAIGSIIAKGTRVAGATEDQFAGAAGETGGYSMVNIHCH